MLVLIPGILGQIPPTPISGGLYNQYDQFESSLSDDEAIITLTQDTENSNSEASATAMHQVIESSDEEEGKGGVVVFVYATTNRHRQTACDKDASVLPKARRSPIF